MAISSPTFKPTLSVGALDITIINSVTSLGKTTITLPDLTQGLVIRSRVTCELKLSMSLGGDFITIKPYCTLRLDGLQITGKILYIESSATITTIEALITHG